MCLSWRTSFSVLTVSQLADLGNLTQPWSIDPSDIPPAAPLPIRGFKGEHHGVPIPLEDLEREYCKLTNQPYPIREMVFVRSWMLFRVCQQSFYVMMTLTTCCTVSSHFPRDCRKVCPSPSELRTRTFTYSYLSGRRKFGETCIGARKYFITYPTKTLVVNACLLAKYMSLF